MATYNAVTKIIASTGASGVNGFTGLAAAQNAAVVVGVTAAQAVTGVQVQSITVSPATMIQDSNGGILEMIQTISYIVFG